MPELKIELPFELLEKLAKLASENNEATRITAVKILSAHVSGPTPDAGDFAIACVNGNHYTNFNGRPLAFCPDCGKPLI